MTPVENSSGDMALPLTADDISSRWLTEALGFRYPSVEVVDAVITQVIHGTSTKFRVRAEYNAAGLEAGLPQSLIVKGGFEEHSTSMGHERLYLLETRFYRDVAPFLEMNVPACYYAGTDPATSQSVVIIEDLTLRSVRFFDAYRTQTYEQVARRLDAMARYHAQTWEAPDLATGGRWDWVPVRYDPKRYGAQMAHYLSPEIWQSFMSLPRGAALPKPLRDLEWMRQALPRMSALHREGPTCLIHGDSHLGNVYEDADGTPGFLDPQIARAPWSMEVSYHIVGALEIADRREWERPLLAHYLARLSAYGVDAPAFPDAWRAYCRDVCHGLYIWIKNENYFQTEPINTANTVRFGAAAIECGTMELLG